ncbi:20785_t:CDS:2, partial [Dentiscutata erythropus]
MNQPQPLIPQTANIPLNSSFDNLTAKQKYEILTKGTIDLFGSAQEIENQTAPQFPTDILSGGGLLGLEAAKALKDLNLDVTMIEMAPVYKK